MYLYFSPKNIIIFLILAALSFAMGGFGGLLWFALISLLIGGFSLIYDHFEWKIKFKKSNSKTKEITKPKKTVRKNHNLKVIPGGKK